MATSTILPADCPACGYSFTLLDVATIQAHFLAHLVARVGSPTSQDTNKDW